MYDLATAEPDVRLMRVECGEMNLPARALAAKPNIRLTRLKYGKMNLTAPCACCRTWNNTHKTRTWWDKSHSAIHVLQNPTYSMTHEAQMQWDWPSKYDITPVVGSQQGIRWYGWICGKIDSWSWHCVVRLALICWCYHTAGSIWYA